MAEFSRQKNNHFCKNAWGVTMKSLLADLVGFDTTSCNSNLKLINYIESYLSRFGAAVTVISDETGYKANLVARFGPADVPGVILSGHTDVVAATEIGWLTSPYELFEQDGKLYGRGTADMKAFLACLLASVPHIVSISLKRPIYLCFSYDEEIGCLGAFSIAKYFSTLTVKPLLAIIGEPSEMKYITGQKGKIAMLCRVVGTAGHSSLAPEHVNAIKYSAKIISMIEDLTESFKQDGPFDEDYSVPYSTMLTTIIHSGTATNITPDSSAFNFEIRSLPGHDPVAVIAGLKKQVAEKLVPAMQAVSPLAGVSWEEVFSYPAMGDASGSDGFKLIKDLLPEWGGKVSYGSEGGVFETIAGIPALIMGPGSIVQAHKTNEYIEIDQLEKCMDFLGQLINHLSK
jgi:acetylornithine deacetylase